MQVVSFTCFSVLFEGLLSLLKVEHALHTSPRKVFVSSSFAPQKKGALCPPLEECRPPSSEGLSSFCSSSGTHPAAASTTTDRTALIASIQESRIRASMQGGNIGAGEGEQEASLLLPVPVGPAYVSTPHGGWGQLRVTGGKARGRRLLMPRTSVLGAVRPMMSKVATRHSLSLSVSGDRSLFPSSEREGSLTSDEVSYRSRVKMGMHVVGNMH